MLLHVFAHIDSDDVILIIKQPLGQGFRQLRLTHTGRSQKQEGADRLRGILDPGLGPDNGLGHFFNRLILSNDSLMQFFIEMKRLISLALRQLCNRNSCPFGNDLCDLILRHILMYQTQILAHDTCFLFLQFFLKLRQFSVLQFSRTV